jgi:hypothetical protein
MSCPSKAPFHIDFQRSPFINAEINDIFLVLHPSNAVSSSFAFIVLSPFRSESFAVGMVAWTTTPAGLA